MSDLTDAARYDVGWAVHVQWAGDVLIVSCPRCRWIRGYAQTTTDALKAMIQEHIAVCPGWGNM